MNCQSSMYKSYAYKFYKVDGSMTDETDESLSEINTEVH